MNTEQIINKDYKNLKAIDKLFDKHITDIYEKSISIYRQNDSYYMVSWEYQKSDIYVITDIVKLDVEKAIHLKDEALEGNTIGEWIYADWITTRKYIRENKLKEILD